MAKPKQTVIPDSVGPKQEVLEAMADEYVELRNKRMHFLKQEIDKRDLLLTKMKELGLEEYEYDDRIVTVCGHEKLKVTTLKLPED